jgi:signal transduction histidine kinase
MVKKTLKGRNKFSRFKESILWRWSAANAIFFFVAVMLVAFVSYMMMASSVVGSNKSGMDESLDEISLRLSKEEQPLTAVRLDKLLTTIKKTSEDGEGQGVLQTSEVLSQMIASRNMNFLVYDDTPALIWNSSDRKIPFKAGIDGKIVSYKVKGSSGYLGRRTIKSKETGQTIGYLVAYYDLSNFSKLSQKLIAGYVVMAIVALALSIFFGYQLTKHFIKPLRKIGSSMEKVAAHPEEPFVPVKFEGSRSDEITQIADFYNQMMERVKYYIEQQRGFVSDVSHELRTPLAVIDGHLHLLERWGKDDPKVLEESHHVIIEEVSNMKQMLEGMLALSRLEQSQLSPEYLSKKTDPVAQVKLVLANFELLHPDFEISFKNDLSKGLLIHIDEGHYVQALMILLNNAAKYSPDSSKSVEIDLTEDENFVLTSVADEGMGMSEEDAHLIFERFFRADKARNREIGGTGLGLPILANIIKLYGGGHVNVETKLNEGSKFTFKIPKVK